ncbi:interferon-inducible GTPase 5-like isoform X2 [Mercenaria mercenaria]|uniref:interferon-inducible GTPase 5-like isoform X2 n=1 Tax=Mercenaria mercenaria TaxID=6596 RepID=UPI00234F983A|nr:interferon-inducible GTPase 5-like isoform X2 [Mercenaria mercenaria]
MEKSVKRKRTRRKKGSRHARNIVNTDEPSDVQKKFQVTDPITGRTCMIAFHSYEDFVQRCTVRFAIKESSDIQFFDADVENVAIDKTELNGLYDGFNIMIKTLDNLISNETDVQKCCGSDAAPEDDMWLDHQRLYGSVPPVERDKMYKETMPSDDMPSDYQRSYCGIPPFGRDKSGKETIGRGRIRSAVDLPRNFDLGITSIEKDDDSVEGKLDRWNLSTLGSEIEQTRCISSSGASKRTAIRNHVVEFGLRGIETVLESHLNKWKKKPLKICITGMAGKGKSSLINSLRNMSPSEPGAAEVGEIECTKECRSYRHPKLDNVLLCDVPGVGTEWFPKDTYLKDIDVDQYDFFMIVSSERFTENDIWLAKKIEERKRKFYFIRTKVDVDMDSIYERKLESFNEKKEFEDLKKKITSQDLRDFGHVEGRYSKCFLLSNKARYRNQYDLPILLQQLKNDVDIKRQEAMLVGTVELSKKVIAEKAALLLARAKNTALLSGTVAAIPIPFISTGIDIAIILQEILFYRKQFGLDDESLLGLMTSVDVSEYTLKSRVKFHTPPTLFTDVGLKGYLSKYISNKVGEKIVQYVVPVVGTVFSCVMSYNFTTALLEDIVNMMKADATNVLMFVANKDNMDIDRQFVRYKCKLDIF